MARPEKKPTGPENDDELVDEQGEESFPSSDPPSSWSGRDEPPPLQRH